MKSQKGFTLIEMVIVIAVIGILMGLVFNGTRSVQSNARDTRRLADLKKIQTYLELYYNKCNYYPGTTASCQKSTPSNWAGLKIALGLVADSGDIPENDPSGNSYYYAVAEDSFSYLLGAEMERGIPTGGVTSGSIEGRTCGTQIYCVR